MDAARRPGDRSPHRETALSRRALLTGLAAGGLTGFAGAPAVVARTGRTPAAEAGPRVASLDYALGETLIALGCPPVAQSAAEDWSRWVVEPALPDSVIDLGASLEINFELLARIRPDLILTTDYVRRQEGALARIAPVERQTIYQAESDPLERAYAVTRALGARLARSDAAESVLRAADQQFGQARASLADGERRDLLLVRFMDSRHARVYGPGSLYHSVIGRLGLANAFTGQSNLWGYATMSIADLAAFPDARLFTFEPVLPDAMASLARSPIWTRLPFVAAGRWHVLPSVLMFGGVPAAQRFARILMQALRDPSAA